MNMIQIPGVNIDLLCLTEGKLCYHDTHGSKEMIVGVSGIVSLSGVFKDEETISSMGRYADTMMQDTHRPISL